MMKVVIRRVLVMPFLLLGIVTATFILAQFTKGNPLVSIIGARALNNPEIVAAAKARWGLDRSVPERYAIYIWNLAHGDLGTSFRTKQPVLTDLAQRLPPTLELVICAMFVGTLGGVTLAVISAEFKNTARPYREVRRPRWIMLSGILAGSYRTISFLRADEDTSRSGKARYPRRGSGPGDRIPARRHFTRSQLERLRRRLSPSDPALSRIGLVGHGHRRSNGAGELAGRFKSRLHHHGAS